MNFLVLFGLVAAALSSVEASKVGIHGVNAKHHAHHAREASNTGARLARRKANGKCRANFNKIYSSTVSEAPISSVAAAIKQSSSSPKPTSTPKAEPTPTPKATPKPVETPKAEPKKEDDKKDEQKNENKGNNFVAEQPKKEDNKNNNSGGGGKGLISSGDCGGARATHETTQRGGPMGDIEFLNCGVRDGGWNPPNIQVGDLKVPSLDDAMKDPNSPFHACQQFIGLFNRFGGEVGVPPILLASIAMQESSCNANTVGGAGEQGLMQLTPDKCGGAPGGNCKEPAFNIGTGARFFAGLIKDNGGNVLKAVGKYNGWVQGMTVESATRMKHSCCRCQNNLDYLHQFFNGWCQNINAYSHNMGIFKNLDFCH